MNTLKKSVSCLIALFLVSYGFVVSSSALTPAFDVTEIYKNSMFYERLTGVELTGDQRRDILNVAISQLGYHEGASKNDFDGMNWSGSSNYVEYNYANRSVYSNGNTYSYAWCASFVTWCARQAGVSTKSIINSVSCDKFVSDFKSKSQYKTRASGYRPIAGDLIFFLSDNADRQYASHIGIVVGHDGSNVYTIEGNTSRGTVNYRSYSLNDTYIVGYAVPSYANANGNYSDFKLKNGYVEPGEYKVTASSLNLRSSHTSSSSSLGTIPKNTVIIITEASGDWGKTSYNGKDGWVSLSYVTPERLEQYEITYDANGGENAPGVTKKTAGVDTFLSAMQPQRTGYDFLGWSKIKDSGNVDFAPGDTYKANADLRLYAVWKVSEVIVTFLDADNTVISTRVYKYGDSVEIPEIAEVKTDNEYIYTFANWDKTVLKTAKTDRTYTAVYTKAPINPETDTSDLPVFNGKYPDDSESERDDSQNATVYTSSPVQTDINASATENDFGDGCAAFDVGVITLVILVSFAVVIIKRKI